MLEIVEVGLWETQSLLLRTLQGRQMFNSIFNLQFIE